MRCPQGALVTRTSPFTPASTVTREVLEEIPIETVEELVEVQVAGKTYFEKKTRQVGDVQVDYVPVNVVVGKDESGQEITREVLEKRETIVPRQVKKTVTEDLPRIPGEYSINNDAGKRLDGDQEKNGRCPLAGDVERVDANTLRIHCPVHGDVDMNAEIWAGEAGL